MTNDTEACSTKETAELTSSESQWTKTFYSQQITSICEGIICIYDKNTNMKIYLLLLCTVLISSFLALTLATKYNLTEQFDFDLTVKIQDHMPQKLLPYLSTFITIGSWQAMSVLVFLSMLLQRRKFWLIGILFILIAIIEIYGKYELQHPPPPQFMALRFQHLNVGQYYVRTEVASSYPSGHAARSAFLVSIWLPLIFKTTKNYLIRHGASSSQPFELALPFGFTLSKATTPQFEIIDFLRITLSISLILGLISFSFLIGFIKVYLGEHWSSDVLGGWLLGSGLGFMTHLTWPKSPLLKFTQSTNRLSYNHPIP